jgi:hypothetical protein
MPANFHDVDQSASTDVLAIAPQLSENFTRARGDRRLCIEEAQFSRWRIDCITNLKTH